MSHPRRAAPGPATKLSMAGPGNRQYALILQPLLRGLSPAFLLVCGSSAQADDSLEDFRVLRLEENWRPYCEARAEREPDPSLKCIALGHDVLLTLGGDLRERIEVVESPEFALEQDEDQVLLHRALLHADIRAGTGARAFIQFGFHESSARSGPVPPTDVNRVDLQQGFLELSTPAGSGEAILRAGRQEISLGTARLVSIRGGPNVRLSFDGLRVAWENAGLRFDNFYVRPVETRQGAFDDPSSDRVALWGSYATIRLRQSATIDAYYLGYRNNEARFANLAGREIRHSLGLRYSGRSNGWDWNTEAVYQFGHVGERDIAAWTLANDTGVTLDAPLAPRIGLKANIASGDAGPSDAKVGTFNALFPRLPYFSEAVLFAPANFYNFHPSISFRPASSLTVSAEWNRMWRTRLADAIYLAPFTPVEGTAGQLGRRSGDETMVSLDWNVSRQLLFEARYVYFTPGLALRNVGGKEGHFVMAALSWRF
jgi:hypothetical protein